MERLRLGTRGSKLAQWQAQAVAERLKACHPGLQVEIVIIKTVGDKILDVALSRIGDKGLFTKELEKALLEGDIDIAVHSLKDLPSQLGEGLRLSAVLHREHPGDVLISRRGVKYHEIPAGGVLGTSSLRYAKRNGIKVLAVTNVVGSSVAREADKVIYTHAGPEIAVASTKAYTTQLVIMYLLALYLAQERGTVPPEELRKLVDELASMDEVLEEALQQEEKIKAIAARYTHVQHTFFLGRGFDNAVAMEGALKLKETSYIHAEAYAAGELKHGPLALISDGVPILKPGATVTTSRVDVDYVVTEYGVASLRGRSIRERVKELINIAHPNFRDYLRSEAERNQIW
jgi:hypothetical protein